MNDSINKENIKHYENSINEISLDNNESLNTSVNSLNKLDLSSSNSAKKRKDDRNKFKKEEERKKKEAEKERIRIEKLEVLKKKEEEKERLRLEKLEEIKKKEVEKERQRLEKLEDIRKKEEDRRKKEEEKEKLKQEKIEKEKQRLELLNAKNEEKKKKEEEKMKEEEEKRRKEDKIRNYFCSYFIKKDPITQKEDEEKNLRFLPFQLKKNMYLAPSCRRIDFEHEKYNIKECLDVSLLQQKNELSYLQELKTHKLLPRKFPKTLHLSRQEEDCIELKNGIPKIKVKYLHFDPREYRRPPYYGTWTKKSNIIRPKNPIRKDETLLDYEVDSDEEWEDEGEGESIDKSGDEEDMSDDDEEEDDGFFVPHGHLSDDEIDEENRILEPDLKKAHEKVQREQWENERKKTNIIVTKCIGCVWIEKESIQHELIKYKIVLLNSQMPICINHLVEKSDEEIMLKSNKLKNNNLSNHSSPLVKSKNKSKVSLNSNQNQQSSQNNQSQSQSTPSIIKFISQIGIKKEKSTHVAQAINEQTSYKSSNAAEKRICSDSDESVGKRLKLEKTNEVYVNDTECNKQDVYNVIRDKENTVACITLE